MTEFEQNTFRLKYNRILREEVDDGNRELAFAVTVGWWEYNRGELPPVTIEKLRKILEIDCKR